MNSDSVALGGVDATATYDNVANSMSKPIKKKPPAVHEHEEIDSSVDSQELEIISIKDAENKARKELCAFLAKKGVDSYHCDDYDVVIKMKKARSSRASDSQGYTVTYTCPNGSILSTKLDVLNSIEDARHKTQSLNQRSSTDLARRTDASAESAKRMTALTLPIAVDEIVVEDFGVVDLRGGFCSPVQIYPLGYRCQQVANVTSSSKEPVHDQTIECEIGEYDGRPEFRITVQGSGETHLASTEAGVWTKVRLISPLVDLWVICTFFTVFPQQY